MNDWEHTPGPWKVVSHWSLATIYIQPHGLPGRPRDHSFARLPRIRDQYTKEEIEANAYLMAAAPSLLEALVGVIHELKKAVPIENYEPRIQVAVGIAERAIEDAAGFRKG